jgi:predicted PurR-regulated permease PerM
LNIATEGLVGIITFYIILDVGSHLSKNTLKESLRRILSIAGIFIAVSFVLLLIYVQLFDQSTALSTFVVIWIGSLAASLLASWKLYHRMLDHSSLIKDRELDVIKIANRQSEEMLKPLKNELLAVQKTMQKNVSMITGFGWAILTNDDLLAELKKV